MNRFEDELKQALRREQPAPDFTDRVMARIAQLPATQKQEKEREHNGWLKTLVGFFQPPPMKWAMAGAMACLLALTGLAIHNARQRQRAIEIAEGEKAKEQVMLAMRIASAKLNVAQKKVQERSER